MLKEPLNINSIVENSVENVETYVKSMFLQVEIVKNLVDKRGKCGNNKNVLWKTVLQ